MKKLYRTILKEDVFYDDEVEKAKAYYEAPDDCKTLEDIADWWNSENCFNNIGEMKVEEVMKGKWGESSQQKGVK